MEVKDIIKKLRKKYTLTQAELSEKSGLPLSTIKSYEIGRSIPDGGNAKILANFFHVSIDHLYGAPHKTLDHADIAEKTGLSDDSIDKLLADNRLAVSAQKAKEQLDDDSVTPMAKAFIKSTLLKHDGTNHTAVVLDALLSPSHSKEENNLLELIYQFLVLPADVSINGESEITITSGNGAGTGVHICNADLIKESLLGSIRDRLIEYRREQLIEKGEK